MKLDSRPFAAAVLLVAACARPPLAELDAAWRAYQSASSAGAAERDPGRFQEAGAALVEGQDFIDKGDYEPARDSLKRARRLAEASSGGAAAPRDDGLAEPRTDSGFTEAPPSNEGVQLSPLVKPGGAVKPAVAAPAAPAVRSAPVAAPPPPPAEPAAIVPSAPSPSSEREDALPERIEAPPGDASPETREIPSAEDPAQLPASPDETARAIREERERLRQAAEERASAPAPTAAPAPVPAARAATAVTAAKPESTRSYVVKKGETLYEIARAQYKDEGAWKGIYAANRDRLANPGDVRAGMKLVLPPASAVGQAPASASAKSAPETYTVRKGENLHAIADKIYGSASYWTLIRDANKDKLSDADEVRAGTKLVLPPKPSSR